jgi:hypothetical protein
MSLFTDDVSPARVVYPRMTSSDYERVWHSLCQHYHGGSGEWYETRHLNEDNCGGGGAPSVIRTGSHTRTNHFTAMITCILLSSLSTWLLTLFNEFQIVPPGGYPSSQKSVPWQLSGRYWNSEPATNGWKPCSGIRARILCHKCLGCHYINITFWLLLVSYVYKLWSSNWIYRIPVFCYNKDEKFWKELYNLYFFFPLPSI